jgi:hypothetical protein
METVAVTPQYYSPSPGVLLPQQYEYYDGRWITVPVSQLVYGIQLGPGIDEGMHTRPGAMLRLAATRAADFIPTWAGTDLQSNGWVQADLVRQALVAQTSPAIASLENAVAARQATIYNTGVTNGR